MSISFFPPSVFPEDLPYVLNLSKLAEILVQILVTDFFSKTMQAFVAAFRWAKEHPETLEVCLRFAEQVNWGSSPCLYPQSSQDVWSRHLGSVYSFSLGEHHLCLRCAGAGQRHVD